MKFSSWVAILVQLATSGILSTPPAHPRENLPPYEDWHPRLLVDSLRLAELPAEIAADEARQTAWTQIIYHVNILASTEPANVLSSNYGMNNFPYLGMVSHLGDEPLASEARAKLQETAVYLIEQDDVWGSGDDLASAKRLRSLLMAYDLGFNGATEADCLAVLAEIRRYLEVMTTDFTFRSGLYNPYCSNHGICIGSALGMAALTLTGEWPEEPLLAAARALGDSLMDRGLTDIYGLDGSYKEGGLYLAWIHRFIVASWEAIFRLEGGVAWNEERLGASMAWTAYQLLPRGLGYFLNRNDCSESLRPLSLHNTLWEWA